MAEVHLRWYHTFLFLFQAILTVTDTTTDILTCLTYREQGHHKWFAVSLGVTVITMVVLCIWSVIASTSRVWQEDSDAETSYPDVIFRNTRINILLGCLCMGPQLHSIEMFLFCACRFKELWKSDSGLRIDKDRLYYLYVHTLNLKMVEGLLESAPQLIIQLYVMLEKSENIELIQIISAPISFLSLTWMITSMEVFREFANYNMKLLYNLVIFLSNVGIIAARTLAITFFTLAFPWWLFLVFCAHCLIINACGFVLWRSKRKQDMFVFIFAYSPLYLLIYSWYYLNKLRGTEAGFSLPLQLGVSIAWHLLFTVENIAMISGYYIWVPDKQWFETLALAVVLIGNVGGMLLKYLSWHCCFADSNEDNNAVFRGPTIRVFRTENRV